MRESPSDPHWLMEARPQGNVVKIAILSFLLFSSSSYSPPGLVCLIVEAPHQENVEDWSIFLSPPNYDVLGTDLSFYNTMVKMS